MKLLDIVKLLDAKILYGEDIINEIDVITAFASDMLSDVLAYAQKNAIFITGLTNPQVLRTVEVLDLTSVIFVRGKTPPKETIELARIKKIPIITTRCIMFETCGRLFSAGIVSSIISIDE